MKSSARVSVASLVRLGTEHFADARSITAKAVHDWIADNHAGKLRKFADALAASALLDRCARELRRMEPTIEGPAEEQIELPGFPKRLPKRLGIPTTDANGKPGPDVYVRTGEATLAEIKLWIAKMRGQMDALSQNVSIVEDLAHLFELNQIPAGMGFEEWFKAVSGAVLAARRSPLNP